MKSVALVLGLLIVVGITWRFPLVRIVPLNEWRAGEHQGDFNAKAFAETFWNERLMNSLDQVADAATVLAALRDNRQQAGERFGRQVGVSRARAFLVRGAGTIVAIDNKGVGVSLTGAGPPPNIVLQTSLLFGNTVRDASGLLNPGDFSNSQHFNAISSELNRIVEARLLPRLKEQAEPGRTIQFVACAQVMPDQAGITPLRMIPLRIAIE